MSIIIWEDQIMYSLDEVIRFFLALTNWAPNSHFYLHPVLYMLISLNIVAVIVVVVTMSISILALMDNGWTLYGGSRSFLSINNIPILRPSNSKRTVTSKFSLRNYFRLYTCTKFKEMIQVLLVYHCNWAIYCSDRWDFE